MVSTNRKRWKKAHTPEKGQRRAGGVSTRLVQFNEHGNGLVGPRRFFDESGKPLISRNGNGTYDASAAKQYSMESGFFDSSLGFAVRNVLGDKEKAEKPFEENVWVRAGVKAKRSGFGKLSLKLYQGDPKDKDNEALEEHELYDLLDDPNPAQTQAEFWRAHVTNFILDGDVFWFLMDNDGNPVASNREAMELTEMPTQLLIVRSDQVEHKTDALGMPEWFRFPLGGRGKTVKYSETFHRTEVVHFIDYDPDNPVRGLGDVKALFREIDLYFQGNRYLDSSVRNGGDPGGFIIFDERLTGGELERRQDAADAELNNANAGRYKLLDRKAKFYPNQTKPKDMEYNSMFEWIRDAILAGIGVPPPVVGVYTDATYNNVETAHREMWRGPNGIMAMAELFLDVFQNKFIRRLNRVLPTERIAGQRLQAAWDTSAVEALQEDNTDKLKVAAEIAAMGVGVSYNETKAELGIEVEDVTEGGDTRLISTGLDTLEAVEAQGSARGSRAPLGASPTPTQEQSLSATDPTLEDGLVYEFSVDPDPKLKARIREWLVAFEKEQTLKLRRIAASSKSENAARLTDSVLASDLTEADLEVLILNEAEWAKKFDRKTRVVIRELFRDALVSTARDLGEGGNFIKITDPQVLQYLAGRQIELSEGVTSTLAKTIRTNLLKGLGKTDEAVSLRELVRRSLPDLTENLRRVFGTKEQRAAAIATTETGIAQNGGRFRQMEASGVVEQIEWLAVGDSATRDSHLQVHRTRVPMGETFANGLKHPHDPDGPAGEVINCRCGFRVHRFKKEAS